MRFMMLMIPKGYETGRARRHADRESRRRHDEVQRGIAEGGRAARARRPASAVSGRARSFAGGKPQLPTARSPKRRKWSAATG